MAFNIQRRTSDLANVVVADASRNVTLPASISVTSLISAGILKANASGTLVAAVPNTDFQAVVSLTTTGSSGASTFNGTTLNIPTYTLTGLGGFANPMTTLGDTIYGGASGVATRLIGNTTTAKQYLSQTGSGSVSAAPAWATIAGADITGAALTKTDDTNVTVTLGGTPATALLRAASITLGWTGQLAVSRGGTGVGTLSGVVIGNGTSAMTAISSTTALQIFRVNAAGTGYEFAAVSTGGGTVTSVAALTLGTTGTDLSSTVATGTTTPVITLNVPTASATNRGALSSADWSTFNSKVSGSGTTNYISKFTGASALGNSVLQEANSNIGLGVTPSAWGTAYKAIQLAPQGVAVFGSTSLSQAGLNSNGFYNGTDWIYNNSSVAGQYLIDGNIHRWYNAITGTAGNIIAFNQAMTLTANNRLLINQTNDNGQQLQVNGSAYFAGQVEINASGTTTGKLYINGSQTGARQYLIENGITGVSNSGFQIRDITGSFTPFSIASTGAATFSSSVTAKGDIFIWGGNAAQSGQITANSAGGGLYIAASGTNQNIRLVPSGTGIVQSIGNFDVTGAGTFSSSVTAASLVSRYHVMPLGTGFNSFEIGNDATAGGFYIYDITRGDYSLTLKNNGNFLIGQTSDSGEKLQVNGSGKFSDSVTVLGTTVQIRDASTNNGARVLFLGSSTAKNFLVGNQWTVSDTFEITPSTTNGGTTFTTPALSIAGSGAATFSSSVTANGIIKSITADQSTSRVTIQNTGTNGKTVNLIAGNPNVDQTGFSIAYGDTNFLRFDNTGTATFSSSVLSTDFRTNGAGYITFDANNAGSGTLVIRGGTTGAALSFAANNAATFSSTLGINGVSDNIKSGTYTPTFTRISNIATAGDIAVYQATYIRIDNIVLVNIGISVNPTNTNTNTEFNVTLPINATSAQNRVGSGTYFGNGLTPSLNNPVLVDITTTNANVKFYAVDNTSSNINISFQYKLN